jgi:hypothetical protein
MRLYHPTTLKILSERADIPKRYSCSVWSEIFKWKASGKPHPKCFIEDDYNLGCYIRLVYNLAIKKGCKLDINKIKKLSYKINRGFSQTMYEIYYQEYFDDNYLFSDACSLYFKGINIFPDIFGDEWRKYIPVESYKEILRQINKHQS